MMFSLRLIDGESSAKVPRRSYCRAARADPGFRNKKEVTEAEHVMASDAIGGSGQAASRY